MLLLTVKKWNHFQKGCWLPSNYYVAPVQQAMHPPIIHLYIRFHSFTSVMFDLCDNGCVFVSLFNFKMHIFMSCLIGNLGIIML